MTAAWVEDIGNRVAAHEPTRAAWRAEEPINITIGLLWVLPRESENKSVAQEGSFEKFRNGLYALCKINKTQEAIADALDYFDDNLIAGHPENCNRAFLELDARSLSPAVLVSILGITIRAKNVPGRNGFYRKALHEIARQKGEKYAAELLSKYR
jgi:hypothetical protein